MNVERFIEEFNIAKKKENYVMEHINNIYIPYLEKSTWCKKIITISTEKFLDDKKIYSSDTVTRHLFYIMTLVNLYTNIDVDFNKISEQYDLLAENGILKIIISLIPSDEREEFDMILEMMQDDFYENYRSIPSWLDTKLEAIQLLFHGYEDAIKEIIDKQVNNEGE